MVVPKFGQPRTWTIKPRILAIVLFSGAGFGHERIFEVPTHGGLCSDLGICPRGQNSEPENRKTAQIRALSAPFRAGIWTGHGRPPSSTLPPPPPARLLLEVLRRSSAAGVERGSRDLGDVDGVPAVYAGDAVRRPHGQDAQPSSKAAPGAETMSPGFGIRPEELGFGREKTAEPALL